MTNDILTKICNKCNTEKLLTMFYINKMHRDGLQYICKMCDSAYSAAWRVANKDKLIAANAAYRVANPERHKVWRAANIEKARATTAAWAKANPDRKTASRDAWNKANPEKVRAQRAAYRANNPEKLRVTQAAWRANNPERVKASRTARRLADPEAYRAYKQNRRARKLEAGGKLSPTLVGRLFKLQRGMCTCCNLPLGNDYHLDHIMPLFLGGLNTDDNMQLSRAICNMQKNAKHPVDFMQSRGFLL